MGRDEVYRSAWQASPLAIVTLDRLGQVRSCNPASERLFVRERDALRGTVLASMSHPLDRGALGQMIDEALAGRIPGRQEIRFRAPTGGTIITGFSVAPSPPGDDGVVCVLRDLGQEKAFRPQLLHAERMASIGMVASVVAHELNNALAGALGCLQLLPRPAEASARELVDSVEGELRRATEIVRELKTYARVEEGMSDRVVLPELAARVKRLRQFHRVDEQSSPLELELDADLPEITGNSNQLLQALLNLVRNAEQAVAALPEERRTIRIRAFAAGEVLGLEVCDRGPGIPRELRARLFEPFYSTKSVGEGTGLGLTVVQAVAAGHGGRVEVQQTPGGGATFRLVLPLTRTVGLAPRPPRRGGKRAKRTWLRGVRILVADDEPLICKIVERACTNQGAIVVGVEDASAAQQALLEQDFDLVLLDVRMPRGGGAAVFRSIRSRHARLVPRTMFMSGELSTDMAELVGRGYAGILHKPFDLGELLDALEGILVREPAPEREG